MLGITPPLAGFLVSNCRLAKLFDIAQHKQHKLSEDIFLEEVYLNKLLDQEVVGIYRIVLKILIRFFLRV
jgi:hypothetical protein